MTIPREHIPAILYDLSMAIGSEIQLQPMLRRLLQRMLYHTGFPAGQVVLRSSKNGDPGWWRLQAAVGDAVAMERVGEVCHRSFTRVFSTLDEQGSVELLQVLPVRQGHYRGVLALPVGQAGYLLLLSRTPIALDDPIRRMFMPILANLERAIHLCESNERYTAFLEDRNRNAELRSERLARALDVIVDGTYIIDPEWMQFVDVNRAGWSVLGYSREELMRMGPADIKPAYTQEQLQATFNQIMRSPARSGSITTEHRHREGRLIPVEIQISAFDSDGKTLIVAVARDISEKLRYEHELERHRDHLEALVEERTRELVEARDSAEKANRTKSDFLSQMSHELRTPLNAILGFAQLLELQLDGALTADQLDNVMEIRQAGQHLLALINELLDLARIESGHIELESEAVDLKKVVSESLSLVRPLAEARHVHLENAVPLAEPPAVRADAKRLKQVVLNLLSNAIKYNRPMGSVFVACGEPREGWLILSIRDTGYGIGAEKMKELFQPFNRLGAEKTAAEGTGIGLALTRRLVEGMGGSIRVESSEGGGTVFSVVLPVLAQD